MATDFENHDDVDVPKERHDAACPQCGEELAIHQPDVELPDRLLGTCDDCKGWYLVNGEGRITMTLLGNDGHGRASSARQA